jgi:DNA-binding LytR/AlgR family response regulator
MTCIAIDDEPMALDVIRDYCEKVYFLELKESFRNALKALQYLQDHKVDLILLDINMPDLTGIQFLKSLNYIPLVIFTTAYSEYALQSYDFNAIDYLLKPIEFDRFLKGVLKAKEHFEYKVAKTNQQETNQKIHSESKKEFVLVKSGSEIHKINLNDIQYIEGTGNYISFITSTKKILSLMNMKEVIELLPKYEFVRVHKSYIISMRHIDLIERSQIRINNKTIPIGSSYKEEFLLVLEKIGK